MAALLQRARSIAFRTVPFILQRNSLPQKILVQKSHWNRRSNRGSNPRSNPRSPYAEEPWTYLESDMYIERYGENPVWLGYRRNFKGAVAPQSTRKECYKNGKPCGNPCPICRDRNIFVHHKNLKLLQQFLCPDSAVVYDSTKTGLCRMQQKRIEAAIKTAQDLGLLPIPFCHVDYTKEDYSNTHAAVTQTPPPFPLGSGELWYFWYGAIKEDERELARLTRIYKDFMRPEE